jgi:hypothetical protein
MSFVDGIKGATEKGDRGCHGRQCKGL